MASDAAGQAATGRIRGRLLRTSGDGVGGATATLLGPGPSRATVTTTSGEFVFDQVPAGTYGITLSLRRDSIDVASVVVAAGQDTIVAQTVDWPLGFADEITVVGPSRTPNRIDDAPAAVSRIDAVTLADQATHHDVARTVQFLEGVQITQGGLYDYNVNTRGFNSSLNRRVAVLVDGRNPADGFFDAQEWASLGMPLDNLASIEMVRGPSAALYGANASSGVMVITTKDPDAEPGGTVRVTFGELDTKGIEARWAGRLSSRWSASVLASARHEGDFFSSRLTSAEYATLCGSQTTDCLPRDARAPLRINDNEIYFGSARLDRTFDGSLPILGAQQRLTMEGGLTHLSGPILQTGVGRGQNDGVTRPWARVALNADHARFQFSYTGRQAARQLTLTTSTLATLSSRAFQFEGQLDRSFAGNRVQVVGGASAGTQRVDSFNDELQRQSAVFAPVSASKQAVFGEVGVAATPQLRLVAAARGDFSSLHDAQVSPRVAAIYSPAPRHTFRVTYSRAFQVPNLSEYFLYTDVAAPQDLASINFACVALAGVNCILGPARVLAVGNRNLALEKTRTIEGGYRTTIGGRARLGIDYYRSRARNFITDLLPQLGTSFGRLNTDFGPWQPPPGVPPSLVAAILAEAPQLSNGPDGSSVPDRRVLHQLRARRFAGRGHIVPDAAARRLAGDARLLVVRLRPEHDRRHAGTPHHTKRAGAYGDGRRRLPAWPDLRRPLVPLGGQVPLVGRPVSRQRRGLHERRRLRQLQAARARRAEPARRQPLRRPALGIVRRRRAPPPRARWHRLFVVIAARAGAPALVRRIA